MKYIFFILPVLIFSSAYAGGKCQQAKSKAKQECSPAELAAAKEKVDTATGLVEGVGSGKLTKKTEADVTTTKNEVGMFRSACEKAIKECKTSCDGDKQQEDQNTQTKPEARKSEAASKECTEGEPQKVANEAKKQEGKMDGLLQALAQLLAALMGKKDEPPPPIPPEDKTCNGTKAGTAECMQTANATSSDFTTGTYRDGEGSLANGDTQMAAADPAKGTPGKLDYSKGFGGGGGGGGASGGGGISPSSSKARDDIGKDTSPRINFGAGGTGGGGGGKGGGGGGGPAMANHNGAPSTRTGEGMDKQVQIAADKALQARGLASDGPLGGISGAHSFDNFIKVEKRIQAERNGLQEH